MAKKNSAPKPETETPSAPIASEPATPDSIPKVETVTAAELSAAVNMPVPSDRAIAAIAEDDKPIIEDHVGHSPFGAGNVGVVNPGPVPQIGELDSKNRKFDPEVFHPKKDSIGRWVSKGGGRKPGSGKANQPAQPAPASFVGGSDMPATPGMQPGKDRYDLAAEAYCRTGYVLLDNIFQGGGEWQPENESEHEGMRNAVAVFLRSIGAVDLPPGLSLVLVVGTYSLGRFQKPNTKKRAKELVAIVKEKITGKPTVLDGTPVSSQEAGAKLAAEIQKVSTPQPGSQI